MRYWLFLLLACAVWPPPARTAPVERAGPKSVYVIPIRDDITKPMVYLVRRGVKEALAAKADLLILDMNTDGGAVVSTIEIIQILNQFKGPTVTYVNPKAFSAGAFISMATEKIYMAPQSVIGAAAVVMLAPDGTGAQDLPKTMEIKMTSALSALVRAQAEKNGHNTDVVQAMIDKTKELKIDGELLNKEGNILTLTDRQAAKLYGNPPKPLLSLGTVESFDVLLEKLGYATATVHTIKTTGAEKIGGWLTAISPILLAIGVIGIYIEFKTPGFGLPGIVGITAFVLYFLGGYAAGLSGLEWVFVFIIGLTLVAVELFVWPGMLFIGLTGAALMLAAIVMALVDLYPNPGPGLPTLPRFETFNLPLQTIVIAIVISAGAIWILSLWLPKTSVYKKLVLQSVSGVRTEALMAQQQQARLGQVGQTSSPLRPGGKARFGEQILDVTSQGDFVSANTPVKIVAFRNNTPVVETI